MHDVYGVDLSDPRIRKGRTWRWLKVRIHGLLTAPPAIVFDHAGNVHRMPSTRLALALDPPDLTGPAHPRGAFDNDDD